VKCSRTFVGGAVALVMALSFAGGAGAAAGAVVVRPGDVGGSWLAGSRPGGASAFVAGPATAPLGIGSLEFTTADTSSSARLFNYGYAGTKLSDLDALSYDAYRASASTNPKEQTIALGIEVDVNGPDVAGGVATLVFEPDYQSGGNAAMKTDTWQTWDAYQGGDAIWWATKDIPGAPVAFNTFVSWSTILAANPDATVAGGIGLFIGSGWDGQFTGNADALEVGVAGTTVTYDFEPQTALVVTAPDTDKVQGAANPEFTPSYAGFILGDGPADLATQPVCTTTATADSPVGSYPITCSGGLSANYSFTYEPGTLTVTAAPTASPTVSPAATPSEEVGGATGTPVQATPPPTSSGGGSADGGAGPIAALMICLAFGALGLLTVESQRRRVRR
jgi:MBG domain (YGX type)